MAFGILNSSDNNKTAGDFYEKIIEFIVAVIVNVIISLVFGVTYISLYYAYLTPIAKLNIMYPKDVAYFINKLRELGRAQSIEKDSVIASGGTKEMPPLKDISVYIPVDGNYGDETTSAGLYTEKQLDIAKDFYDDQTLRNMQNPAYKIKFSQQDLPAYPTAEGYYKALCDTNNAYKEIKSLIKPWTCVPSEIEFAGCDGEDLNEGSKKLVGGENNLEGGEEEGGFFSDVKDFVNTTMTFYQVPEDWGLNLKTGTLLLPLLWLVVWIIVFAVALVIKFGVVILKSTYNLCFGCWGSSLWGAGSFNYFTHIIMIYSTVYAGKFTNWYIRNIGSMPMVNFIFGVPVFLTATLVTTLLSWIFMTINVVKDPWWRPGSYAGISKLFLWMIASTLVMARVFLLFVFNFLKINFQGAFRPHGEDGKKLRYNIYKSDWLRLPLRIIFVLLTLNSGMVILDDNSFIGLAILGVGAIASDSWKLFNRWWFAE